MQSHIEPVNGATPDQSGRNIARIAYLVAIASVLQISESLIPHPVPGVRLGLANMITLVALVNLGFSAALEIALLRTVISSFILGTFLTPTFMLSFGSAMASTVVMWFFYRLSARWPAYGFSLIGVSIIGAIGHNLAQLVLAYYLLVKHPSIFYFLPVLMISGIIMGVLTGLVAVQVILKLKRSPSPAENESVKLTPDNPAVSLAGVAKGDSLLWQFERSELLPGIVGCNSLRSNSRTILHRLGAAWKIMATLGLSILIIFLSDWRGYIFIAGGLLSLMLLSRSSLSAYALALTRIRRLASLIFISFLFPVIFTAPGSNVLGAIGPLKIGQAGLIAGGLFAVRIVFLVWIASLLNYFTAPEEMTGGIRKILYPFRIVGMPINRIAAVISLAWSLIPGFGEKVRLAIKNTQPHNKRPNTETWSQKAKRIIGSLANLITSLYQQSEQVSHIE
jgi:heptaprenyl diphosphate synthase